MKKMLCRFCSVLLCLLLAPNVFAQDSYPSNPFRMVLGFTSGGTTDLFARLLTQKIAAQMNVSGIVDNRPGASANIAAELVAKSKPDGYTLLFNNPGVILSPAFDAKLNYDLFKDLAPVALVGSTPFAIVVWPGLPANTPAEFIAHVKANPDKLAYGSTGAGGGTHLAALLFLQANGLSALHVPYKGAPAALLDLAAGRIQFRFTDVPSMVAMVKDKRLKAIATGGRKRTPLLPDMPTLSETVMPGFEVSSWFGVMVPAQTPAAIVRRLNTEIEKAMQDTEMRSRLEQEGVEPLGSTPEAYGAYLKGELARWSKVIKSAGVTLE